MYVYLGRNEFQKAETENKLLIMHFKFMAVTEILAHMQDFRRTCLRSLQRERGIRGDDRSSLNIPHWDASSIALLLFAVV